LVARSHAARDRAGRGGAAAGRAGAASHAGALGRLASADRGGSGAGGGRGAQERLRLRVAPTADGSRAAPAAGAALRRVGGPSAAGSGQRSWGASCTPFAVNLEWRRAAGRRCEPGISRGSYGG